MMVDVQASVSAGAAAVTVIAASDHDTVDVESSSNSNDEKMRKLLKPAPTRDDVRDILIHYYYDGDDSEASVHILKQLDSYDDCNYQVVMDDEMYLLKITNGLESRDYITALSSSSPSIIEFQHSIMNTLHEHHIGTTVPVKPVRYDRPTTQLQESTTTNTRKRSIDTALVESTTIPFGNSSSSSYRNESVILHNLPVVSKSHSPTYLAVRLYVWVSGQPMATIPYHRISLHTMVNVGQQLGRIHHVFDKLSTSSNTAMTTTISSGDDAKLQSQLQSLPQHRYHQWDTKNTYDLLSFTQYIPDTKRRSMIESIIHTFHDEILTRSCNSDDNDDDPSTPTSTTTTSTVATKFRRGIIMGDYNDANIILHSDSLQFNGVIDFGDSVESWRILDITIAMAYAMLTTYGKNQRASISAMAAMLRGYNSIYPLTSLEREHLILLIVCRLACSVTLGAYSIQQNPENAVYLSLHSKPAWDALELLWGYDMERRKQMKCVLNQVFDQACSYMSVSSSTNDPSSSATDMNEIPPSYDLAFPDPSVVDPLVSIREK